MQNFIDIANTHLANGSATDHTEAEVRIGKIVSASDKMPAHFSSGMQIARSWGGNQKRGCPGFEAWKQHPLRAGAHETRRDVVAFVSVRGQWSRQIMRSIGSDKVAYTTQSKTRVFLDNVDMRHSERAPYDARLSVATERELASGVMSFGSACAKLRQAEFVRLRTRDIYSRKAGEVHFTHVVLHDRRGSSAADTGFTPAEWITDSSDAPMPSTGITDQAFEIEVELKKTFIEKLKSVPNLLRQLVERLVLSPCIRVSPMSPPVCFDAQLVRLKTLAPKILTRALLNTDLFPRRGDVYISAKTNGIRYSFFMHQKSAILFSKTESVSFRLAPGEQQLLERLHPVLDVELQFQRADEIVERLDLATARLTMLDTDVDAPSAIQRIGTFCTLLRDAGVPTRVLPDNSVLFRFASFSLRQKPWVLAEEAMETFVGPISQRGDAAVAKPDGFIFHLSNSDGSEHLYKWKPFHSIDARFNGSAWTAAVNKTQAIVVSELAGVSPPSRAGIYELHSDARGRWRVTGKRNDKQQPNSIDAVIASMVATADGVSLSEMVALLQYGMPPAQWEKHMETARRQLLETVKKRKICHPARPFGPSYGDEHVTKKQETNQRQTGTIEQLCTDEATAELYKTGDYRPDALGLGSHYIPDDVLSD